MKALELSNMYPEIVSEFWSYCFNNPNGISAWQEQTGLTIDGLLLRKLRSHHCACIGRDILSYFREKRESLSYLLRERKLLKKAHTEPFSGAYIDSIGINMTFARVVQQFNKLSIREQKKVLQRLEHEIEVFNSKLSGF